MQGSKRSLAQKKRPITKEMLKEIVAGANYHLSLANIRLVTAYLLAFSGFLCFDEL